MKRLLIVGASGHAKVVAEAVERQQQFELVGFLDRAPCDGARVHGHPILGSDDELSSLLMRYSIDAFVVGIGNSKRREKITKRIQAVYPQLLAAIVIHPFTSIARDVHMGPGTVVLAGVVIGPGCRIGSGCLLNTRCSLDHDSMMGNFASLAPNVTTGGNVTIGESAFVGLSANVCPGVNIGCNSVIGAGSTVLNDIPDDVLAYGTPTAPVRDITLPDSEF